MTIMTSPTLAEPKPIFVISDLHLGSGGNRDNFVALEKKKLIMDFLDMVEDQQGELILLGDVLDLWRFSLSKTLEEHAGLLDRIVRMKAHYVPGNHDLEVLTARSRHVYPHRLFEQVALPIQRTVGGKKMLFMHGHEVDFLNKYIRPGIGRSLAMTVAVVEYLKGGQLFSSDYFGEKAVTWEAHLLKFFNDILRSLGFGRCDETSADPADITCQLKQQRYLKKFGRFDQRRLAEGKDVIISAHTHQAGRFDNWYFNSGSWTAGKQNFLKILPDGLIEVCDWTQWGTRLNRSVLA